MYERRRRPAAGRRRRARRRGVPAVPGLAPLRLAARAGARAGLGLRAQLGLGRAAQRRLASCRRSRCAARSRRCALLFRHRGWLIGFVVGLAGGRFYVAALALAPLSLVQATSAGGYRGARAASPTARRRRRSYGTNGSPCRCRSRVSPCSASRSRGDRRRASSAAWLPVLGWLACSACRGRNRGRAGRRCWSRAPGSVSPQAFSTAPATSRRRRQSAAACGWCSCRSCSPRTALPSSACSSASSEGERSRPRAPRRCSRTPCRSPAGIALFHEQVPGGGLGALRVAAFALVVVGAAVLARGERGEPGSPVEAGSVLF